MATRRDFLKNAIGGGLFIGTGGLAVPARAAKRSATDWVTLGNSGVKVTRLALGTGTVGGRVQRELGQEQFTRIVRHAYDSGIRFFETAEAYKGMPEMLGIALKGIPRDSYRLMTKFRWQNGVENPAARIDGYRKQLNSDYFDILLVHCVRKPTWQEELAPLRDALSEAKQKKVILSHGASCHGLQALRTFPGNKWLDVALMRINHDGTRMDTMSLTDSGSEKGDVREVSDHVGEVHAQGTGVIGMKLIGEGQFTTPEQRDASIRRVMKLGTVDAVTVGFKTPAEIDEVIQRINTHLNT